jgi:hypothetical protein
VNAKIALSARDRFIVGMLVFFLIVAFTLELWWLLHSPAERVALQDRSLIAHLFAVYAPCDRNYFDLPSPFATCLEGINVYFTQLLNLSLIFAIVRRRSYRYPLQLIIGSYLSYSLILYFLVGHVSGYASMSYRSAYTYFLFYGVNAPWLLGHLYLLWDATRAITRQFADPLRMRKARQRETGDAMFSGSASADTNDARPAS